MDELQDKIRKKKNPLMVGMEENPALLPEKLGSLGTAQGYGQFCRELMEGLQGLVPAVRLSVGQFALLGPEGLTQLEKTLEYAGQTGYYTALDLPELPSPWAAEQWAERIGQSGLCGGVVISPYLGTDVIRPFMEMSGKRGVDVFVLARTGNRSAPEVQDLLTGSRLVHSAVADIVSRMGEELTGKSGYSQMGIVAGAGAPDSLRALRDKYRRTFLLVDGVDYPNANIKGSRFAFDTLGHGAVVCAGGGVARAWRAGENPDYVAAAVEEAERLKRNLNRYVTVL